MGSQGDLDMIDPDTELQGIPVALLDENGEFLEAPRAAYRPDYEGAPFLNDIFTIVEAAEVDRAVQLGEYLGGKEVDEDFTFHLYLLNGVIYVSAQAPTDEGE